MNTKKRFTAYIYSKLLKDKKEKEKQNACLEQLIESFNMISKAFYPKFIKECTSDSKSILHDACIYEKISSNYSACPEYGDNTFLAIAFVGFATDLFEANFDLFTALTASIDNMKYLVFDIKMPTAGEEYDYENIEKTESYPLMYHAYRSICLCILNYHFFKVDSILDNDETIENKYDIIENASKYTYETFNDILHKAIDIVYTVQLTDENVQAYLKNYHMALAMQRYNLIGNGACVSALNIIDEFLSEAVVIDAVENDIADFDFSDIEETLDTMVRIVYNRKKIFDLGIDTEELDSLFNIAIDAINNAITTVSKNRNMCAATGETLYQDDLKFITDTLAEIRNNDSDDEEDENDEDLNEAEPCNEAEPSDETESE